MQVSGKYSNRFIRIESCDGETTIEIWASPSVVYASMTVDTLEFFEGLSLDPPDGVTLKVVRPIELPTTAGSVIRIRRDQLDARVLELRSDGLWRVGNGFWDDRDIREEIADGGSLTVLFDAAKEE